MKRFWILILIAGIAIVAMSAYHFMVRPGKGDLAPVFELKDLSGAKVSLADFGGKPVLLHFWATWCEVCREEFPSILRLQKDFKDKGLMLIAISEDDKNAIKAINTFLNGISIDFPVLIDEGGKVADRYSSFGVPESLLINRKGTIEWRHGGLVNWDDQIVRDRLTTLIDENNRLH